MRIMRKLSIAHRNDLARLGDPVALSIIAAQYKVPHVIVQVDDSKQAVDQVMLIFHAGSDMRTVFGFDPALIRQASEKVLGNRACLIHQFHHGIYIPEESGSPYKIHWLYQETDTGYQVFMKTVIRELVTD